MNPSKLLDLHIDLWWFLADNPTMSKHCWFAKEKTKEKEAAIEYNHCFLCLLYRKNRCYGCKEYWPNYSDYQLMFLPPCGQSYLGLYNRAQDLKDFDFIRHLALKIMNIGVLLKEDL